ncbi:hypothetical protein H0H93_010458 [Arthromyces matolae]|nr:hypothetical protein H0H93_010458 [Arthromyces matolae]
MRLNAKFLSIFLFLYVASAIPVHSTGNGVAPPPAGVPQGGSLPPTIVDTETDHSATASTAGVPLTPEQDQTPQGRWKRVIKHAKDVANQNGVPLNAQQGGSQDTGLTSTESAPLAGTGTGTTTGAGGSAI